MSLTEDLGLHWDGMEEREHTPLSKPGAMLLATNKATQKHGSPSGFGVFLVYWLHHWLSRYTDPEATSKSVDTQKKNQTRNNRGHRQGRPRWQHQVSETVGFIQ